MHLFLLALITLADFPTLKSEAIDSSERNTAFIGYKEHDAAHALPEAKLIVIKTSHGSIRINLRPDLSPKIVSLVTEVAMSKSCLNCKFYRHEPAPDNFGKDSFYGPPYALLQGSLADMKDAPPFEGSPIVEKGSVCIIPGSKEFFIATARHEEWGHSHSVWGEVGLSDHESWATIARIPTEPYTTLADSSGKIITRWLTANVTETFSLTLE
jgi:hypothetical protein